LTGQQSPHADLRWHTAATIATRTLSGVVGHANVNLTGVTGPTFDTRTNTGTGKTVHATA